MKHATLISRLCTVGAALALCPVAAHAAGVAAGTVIENSANVQYTIGDNVLSVTTNTDVVIVDEVVDLSLASLDAGVVPVGAEGGVLTFEVTNNGNGPEPFDIIVERMPAGSIFDPSVTSVAYDSNGNGQYDPGIDGTIQPGQSTPEVPADGSLVFFVITAVAPDSQDGSTASITVNVNAATGHGSPGSYLVGQGSGGGSAVVGPTTGFATIAGEAIALVSDVALVKSVTISDPYGGKQPVQGAVATYSIRAVIGGSGTVDDLQVTDNIPAGTSYRPGTLKLDNASLTDSSGDDQGEANGSAIAVALGSVAGGRSHTISFQVTIN